MPWHLGRAVKYVKALNASMGLESCSKVVSFQSLVRLWTLSAASLHGTMRIVA